MEIAELSLNGLLKIKPKKIDDERGFFMERGKQSVFRELDLKDFVQDNYSRSAKNVLRGIHYQHSPHQGKLVTCTHGKILDVVVDLRTQSSTFGKCNYLEMNGENPEWLWVPPGFGHGFVVLSDEGADLWYKVDQYYNAAGENGIQWNDPTLNIDWKTEHPNVSPKDANLPSFADYQLNPQY